MLQQQRGRSKSSQSMVPAVAATFGSQGSKGVENISKAINVYSSTSNAPTQLRTKRGSRSSADCMNDVSSHNSSALFFGRQNKQAHSRVAGSMKLSSVSPLRGNSISRQISHKRKSSSQLRSPKRYGDVPPPPVGSSANVNATIANFEGLAIRNAELLNEQKATRHQKRAVQFMQKAKHVPDFSEEAPIPTHQLEARLDSEEFKQQHKTIGARPSKEERPLAFEISMD